MTWVNPFPELEIRSVNIHFGGRLRPPVVVVAEGKPASGPHRNAVRLFKYTWRNPLPGTSIECLDYASTPGAAAPFLVGITIKP